MAKLSYQDIAEIAGLGSDGVSGFEAQVLNGSDTRPAAWPEHFTGLRIDRFMEGAEIARRWLFLRQAAGRARRKVRAEERRGQGMMTVLAATGADLVEEQREDLRRVMRHKGPGVDPSADSGKSCAP